MSEKRDLADIQEHLSLNKLLVKLNDDTALKNLPESETDRLVEILIGYVDAMGVDEDVIKVIAEKIILVVKNCSPNFLLNLLPDYIEEFDAIRPYLGKGEKQRYSAGSH